MIAAAIALAVAWVATATLAHHAFGMWLGRSRETETARKVAEIEETVGKLEADVRRLMTPDRARR